MVASIAPTSALLLLNPNARRGSEHSGTARSLLADRGIHCIEPADGVTFSQAIHTHAHEVDCVIAGGGDGTLNAVVKATSDASLPLGILPLGTANDFARSIGIPMALPAAVETIAHGHARAVDLGLANGHAYLNVASIGFSAELAGALSARDKKRWGKLGYAVTAARLLAGSRVFDASITHDGHTERFRTFQVSVGNGRFYGGGMTVHSDASPMDGMLDVYSLEIDHWWTLLRLLPALRRGTHGQWKDVRAFSTRQLVVDTARRRPVNLDGELKTTTPVKFGILQGALRIFAP